MFCVLLISSTLFFSSSWILSTFHSIDVPPLLVSLCKSPPMVFQLKCIRVFQLAVSSLFLRFSLLHTWIACQARWLCHWLLFCIRTLLSEPLQIFNQGSVDRQCLCLHYELLIASHYLQLELHWLWFVQFVLFWVSFAPYSFAICLRFSYRLG